MANDAVRRYGSGMKLVLDEPNVEPFEPTKDLKVFVGCESSASSAQACALLERVAQKTGAEGRLICSWWNFDVLAITAVRKLAAAEAAQADMIIIAAHDRLDLPPEVKAWIHQWLAQGENHSRALVALLPPEGKKPRPAHGIISRLRKVAELGRMDFFANGTAGELEAALSGGAVPPPGNSPRRAEARHADCRA